MRKPQSPILYLYEVREVDVDEHLGEVAVLEERDVGGAADRGVELLRERGLGSCPSRRRRRRRRGACCSGGAAPSGCGPSRRRSSPGAGRGSPRGRAAPARSGGGRSGPRRARDEEDVREVAERLALREAVEEGGGGQPLVLQRELGEAARLEGKGWQRERRCRARREGGDGARRAPSCSTCGCPRSRSRRACSSRGACRGAAAREIARVQLGPQRLQQLVRERGAADHRAEGVPDERQPRQRGGDPLLVDEREDLAREIRTERLEGGRGGVVLVARR